MYVYNFISPNASEEDTDLFFGPLNENEQFILIQPTWIMAHVMHAAECFKSISQARKNGWDKPIPSGFSMYVVGKRKAQIYILNLQ